MTSTRSGVVARLAVAGIIVIVGALTGCRGPMGVEPPASAKRLDQIRAEFRKENPTAIVGRVVDVYQNFAAIGDVDVQDFREGDVVTFVDSKRKPMTTGKVVRMTAKYVHVQFDPPKSNGRAPVAGDLMVRVK